MRRSLSLIALTLLLVGCAPPVIRTPYGQACLVYADATRTYSLLALRLADACAAKKIPADTCVYLKQQDEIAKLIDADIRNEILKAESEIDWAKVMQYLQLLAGVAIKAAI